jgi:D-alanyl-lipoteichoic acid acyltransferase DltB (MBOAT superfamily)
MVTLWLFRYGTVKIIRNRFTRNFNYPYFSRDIAEFWRRWHIHCHRGFDICTFRLEVAKD